MPRVLMSQWKVKLAATLRRVADALSPAPSGSAPASATTWVNCSGAVTPYVSVSGTTTGGHLVIDGRFEEGDGGWAHP